jgi:hypothetical protein
MNYFSIDPVLAIEGIVFAFLWGVVIGFFLGFIRFLFFGILERYMFVY